LDHKGVEPAAPVLFKQRLIEQDDAFGPLAKPWSSILPAASFNRKHIMI
jgi:hypothetical protein